MTENENGKPNGNWKQAIVAGFMFLLTVLNGVALWILTDVKFDIRQNRQEFYSKIDRVVSLYRDEQKIVLSNVEKLCSTVSDQGKLIKEHETLLHFNHPQRQKYFQEK